MKINPNLVDIYRKDTIKISKLQEEYIKWYDSLQTRYPLSYYLTNQDIAYLYRCAMSPSLNCDVKEKYHLIGELMRNRGFELIGGGTNRRAYRCTFEDLVIKIATDQVGFTSNLREYPNQNVIKPFCTKIFGTDYNGVVSMSEQFIPFKTVEEFQKYSQDIFDILYFKLRNNDIGMEDVGTRSFKNWGLRNGFGPGMLDFPTMYVLDPTKRFCRNIVNGQMCGGTLDYDEGFNVIVCSECGRTHFVRTLAKKDGEDISKLLQAVGYQQRKSEKESFSMKIKLVNLETGEVESVREVGGKSNFVDPNRRKRPKQVINLNEPQKTKKKKEIKFKDVVIGTLNPETGEIEDGATLKVKPEFIFDKPVMTTEKKPYIGSYCIAEDEIEELIDKNKKHSVEEVINTFDKLIVDTTMNYEGNNDPNNVMDIIDVINNNINGITHIPREKAESMFKELSVATLDLDYYGATSISDDTIMVSDNTMIARLVQRIIRNPEDNFTAFEHLINTVKNSAAFFESVIGFFKTVLEHFSYDTEEKVGGEDYHYMYKDVFNIARKAIAYVFDDFLYNIMLNGVSNSFSGHLVYNRNNAFVKLRDCLKEMSEAFNNAEKASESTDKTASIQLYRRNDYAELYCFFTTEDDDNDNETELDASDDTEENTTYSSEDNEDISEEVSTENSETDEEVETEGNSTVQEEISNVAEEEEVEEEIPEKDADGTVENIVDNVSSTDTSDSNDEPVIPVRKKIELMSTNTAGMFDSYNKMSRKQRRKFEKGNKKKRK